MPGGGQGPKTVKGAQGDPNYVSRLLLDRVPVFHKCDKIITLAYLLYCSGPVANICREAQKLQLRHCPLLLEVSP